MTEKDLTDSFPMCMAIPLGENKWLRKTVTAHYRDGRLAKVDGIRLNIDPSSKLVHDTLYHFENLKDEADRIVFKVFKLVFVHGKLTEKEDFSESFEEKMRPRQTGQTGELTP